MRRYRRSILASAGAASITGMAGCTGLSTFFGSELPDCTGPQTTGVPVPIRGRSSAPVSVVVFSDFASNECKTFAEDAAPRIGDHIQQGNVLYWYRDFPIPVSERSFPVANAARAVQDNAGTGAFWLFYERVFANQGEYGTAELVEYAEDLSVPPEAIRSAVADAPYCELIKADRSRGNERGVDETPTVFVEDRKLVSPSPEEFERTVDEVVGNENS